ncbi:MAG: hypothetical protein H6605_03520 [Flavobacteriales bacterium]|nr:hypothetical protein [Flavobacteriales bacterium]
MKIKSLIKSGLILLVLTLSSFIYKAEIPPDHVIEGRFKFFTTDKFGNVFAITFKNDIQKFDRNGKKITEANFKVLGNASFIDAGNPMELYVLFKDQNKIVYFDNMLNYRGETDLFKEFYISNIQVICRSYDNGFWFFDPDNFKLKKATKSGEITSESINLSAILDHTLQPELMEEDGQNVYLKGNAGELYVFDILGNYLKNIHLDSFGTFQVKKGSVMYASGSNLFLYNPSTFENTLLFREYLKDPDQSILGIRVEEKTLYKYLENRIELFEIK